MISEREAEIQSQKRKLYWDKRAEHCQGVNKVLNVTEADKLSQMEIEEFLQVLPSFEGKLVCDLGAGIGRYTGVLAKKAKHVTAVDLVEELTAVNREENGAMGNIDFITSDVVQVEFPSNSFYLIFTNYLLQYLTEREADQFALNALQWLKDDGYLFFREVSATPLAGPENAVENPSICRTAAFYKDLFDRAYLQIDGSDEIYKFSLVTTNQVQCVKKMLSRETDHYFIYQKIRCSPDGN
ncbi:uncharacterized protein [Ptychodera flava]